MRKIISFLLVFILTLSVFALTACGKKDDDKGGNDTPEEVKYTVEYSGTSMASQEVKEGTSISQPSDPSKSGYIFGGWYLDANYSTEAKFPMTINKNTTIYAMFTDYQTAFKKAREKTIGDNVAGYEFDYTLDVTATYNAVSAKGKTVGNSKYSTSGDVKFYDAHVNSDILFYDGSKYQIRTNTELQKISLDENDVLKNYSVEEVDDSYKFDSSSFAKALFEYSDDKLNSIETTTNTNEYKLNTSFSASAAISIVGNILNSSFVEKTIGSLPETSVNTGMYVTFTGGEIKTYRYEMHIDVSSIKFDLVYNLTFKNVGTAQTINPRVFSGLSLKASEIANTKTTVDGVISSYMSKSRSGYDFEVQTGVEFPSKNEINSTFQGSTLRKVDGTNVFFHNDIEIDSDYKNADLYKAAGISDVHIKKTKLSTGEVYNIEKKTLKDATYLIERYQPNVNDSYYLLDALSQITGVTFIQTITDTKKNETTYAIGLSTADVVRLLKWFNANMDLDPLGQATVDVKLFGDFTDSSVVVKDSQLTILVKDGTLAKILLEAKGEFNTKLADSIDFTSTQEAEFNFNYTITMTNKGDSFEPYDTVNKAK